VSNLHLQFCFIFIWFAREKPPNHLDGLLFVFTFWFESKLDGFLLGKF